MRQGFGGYGLAKAGVADEGGVKMAFARQAQQRASQAAGFHRKLLAKHHFAGHFRVEGELRGLFLRGQGRALLKHAGGGIGRQLQHGQQGRVHVAGDRTGDSLHAGRGRPGPGMSADVFLFGLGQGAALHAGHDFLGALEGFRDQAHQRLQAAFGARQGVDIGVKRAFDAGGFEQPFLDAHDFSHEHGRIVLPLGRVANREGRGNPDRQPIAHGATQAG